MLGTWCQSARDHSCVNYFLVSNVFFLYFLFVQCFFCSWHLVLSGITWRPKLHCKYLVRIEEGRMEKNRWGRKLNAISALLWLLGKKMNMKFSICIVSIYMNFMNSWTHLGSWHQTAQQPSCITYQMNSLLSPFEKTLPSSRLLIIARKKHVVAK